MYSPIFAIVFVAFFISMEKDAYGQLEASCGQEFYKLGCYMDQRYTRGLPQLLFTDRDRSSPLFRQSIDWKNWDQYIHGLACQCASQARSLNYTMFGLQYYGECWAGLGSCDTYDQLGESQRCYGRNYTRCDNDDEHECVGGPDTNYVYLLTE